MGDTIDADGGNRCAFNRTEQYAPQSGSTDDPPMIQWARRTCALLAKVTISRLLRLMVSLLMVLNSEGEAAVGKVEEL